MVPTRIVLNLNTLKFNNVKNCNYIGMGRKRTSPVHKYFKFNILSGKSVCQIDSCGHELVGEHAKNLERHIESLHYDIFAKYLSVESREIERKKKCKGLTSIQAGKTQI